MGNPKRKIDRLIKLHQTWLQDTGPELLSRTTRRLNDNLSEASLPALRSTDSLLSRIANYYGTKGVVELFEFRPTAWDSIYLSCAFHLHQLRLGYALWTKLADEPSLTLKISKIACALCFALANNLSEWTTLFADMLSQAEWNDQMVKQVYWKERKFEPFALRLAQIDGGKTASAPDSSKLSEVYSALLADWNSPELFSHAMVAACDYHCENIEEKGGNDDFDPEFDHPPFDLIPWEILAIIQVRKRLGMVTREPNHPLFANVTNFVPRSDLPVDERITAVELIRDLLGMSVKE